VETPNGGADSTLPILSSWKVMSNELMIAQSAQLRLCNISASIRQIRVMKRPEIRWIESICGYEENGDSSVNISRRGWSEII
jgi:hypothetical protein